MQKPSVLWRFWLGGRKGIRPLKKTEWWGAGMVIHLELGADLHMTQLMLLPLTVSCFSKIQIGFTFLVPAHQGRPGKRAVKRVCVCVCVCCRWKIHAHTIHQNHTGELENRCPGSLQVFLLMKCKVSMQMSMQHLNQRKVSSALELVSLPWTKIQRTTTTITSF